MFLEDPFVSSGMKQTWNYMVQKIPQRNPNKSKGQMPRWWFPSIDACGMCLARVCSVRLPNRGARCTPTYCSREEFLSCLKSSMCFGFVECCRLFSNSSLLIQHDCANSKCLTSIKLSIISFFDNRRALKKGQWVEIDFAKHGLGRQIHHYSLILCSCEVMVSMFGPNFKQRQGTP